MKRICTLLAITLICTSVHAQEITVTTGKCIIRNNRDIPVWVWWDEEGISQGPVAEYIKDYFCRWRPGGDWMNYFQILAEGNMASGSSSGDLLMYKILQPKETFEILTGNTSRSTVERSVRKCLAVISQEEMDAVYGKKDENGISTDAIEIPEEELVAENAENELGGFGALFADPDDPNAAVSETDASGDAPEDL